MRLKNLFFTLILFSLSGNIFSQSLEIGLTGGVGNYEGDLAPFLFVPAENHPMGGAFARFNFNRYFSLRGQVLATKISGTDANSKALDAGRLARNLSFESNIQELSIMPEINLAFFKKNSFLGKFTGFIYGGVALFRFDPTTQYQGETVRLQPLGTEGQGIFGNEEKYALTQFSIPMGAGLKIFLNDRWTVTIEGAARKTFTDHLDDVSTSYVQNLDELISANGPLAGQLSSRNWEYLNAQCNCENFSPANSYPTGLRGDAGDDDWYLTAGITISYKLRDIDFSRKGSGGCPNNF